MAFFASPDCMCYRKKTLNKNGHIPFSIGAQKIGVLSNPKWVKSNYYWPRRLACAMRACVRHAYWPRRLACLRVPCVAWPLLSPSFSLSLFFSVFCFRPTSGNLPCVKTCFPQVIEAICNFYLFFYLKTINYTILQGLQVAQPVVTEHWP